MAARSFTAGAACGAAVGLAAGLILGSTEEAAVAPAAMPETSPAAAPIATTVVPDEPRQSQADAAIGYVSGPEAHNAGSMVDDSGMLSWPANQWQKLELEPKDDSWAYYMEQTLLQFLGSHTAAAQFKVSRIECRTTMCQLEVVGYDASTAPVWQQLMYDVRHQPWSEFGRYGSSSGDVDGEFVLIGTFWRVTAEP